MGHYQLTISRSKTMLPTKLKSFCLYNVDHCFLSPTKMEPAKEVLDIWLGQSWRSSGDPLGVLARAIKPNKVYESGFQKAVMGPFIKKKDEKEVSILHTMYRLVWT